MPRTTEDPAVKKSVSFPKSLLRAALTRSRSLGWNLSQYLQHLMREDLIRRGAIVRTMEEPATEFAAPPPASAVAEEPSAPGQPAKKAKQIGFNSKQKRSSRSARHPHDPASVADALTAPRPRFYTGDSINAGL